MSAGKDLTGVKWVLKDDMFSVEHMYKHVEETVTALNLSQSLKALRLMKKYHDGQVRKGKDKIPYIYHPLLMACHALALGIADDILLPAVLLHDVPEDCNVPVEELDIDDDIKEIVRLLTFKKPSTEDEALYHKAKSEYFDNIRHNKTAAIVKLLDRCSNVSQMVTGFSKEKIVEYIVETEEMVLPLLNYVKATCPEYYDAVFLIKYQMRSVMETLKRTL